MTFVKGLLIALFMTITLDYLWLGYVVKPFNLSQLSEIGRISNGQFNIWLPGALMAYALMALVLMVFVIPLCADKSLLETAALGALMGFCVYGIFDMTNAAILKNYPMLFAFADMAWGTFLFGATAVTLKYFL
ncbi:MAG: DUF2177 family protein [Bdellovibrionales bacterium]